MTENVSLIDSIDQVINSADFNLPVFSDIAIKVRKMVSADDYNVQDVEKLIHSDQSLASEILRVANSPFYAGLSNVATVRDAAVRLGANQLADLVVLAAERNRYSAKNKEIDALMGKLWRHSVGVALAAQWLTKKLGYTVNINEVFLGGLIHDIGKLAALKAIDYIKAKEHINFPGELITQIVDSVHTLQGYNLAHKWRLPENYCAVIRDHHLEDIAPSNYMLLIVKVADSACTKLGINLNPDASIELAVLPEAHSLGIGEVLLAELEIMLEDTMEKLGE
ncbi:MAG: HDOD domain-containing protein [Desulfurivibrionaceae bacterium]